MGDSPWINLFVKDSNGNLVEYEGAQFHFHAVSEHTVDGKHYDAVMHVVTVAK